MRIALRGLLVGYGLNRTGVAVHIEACAPYPSGHGRGWCASNGGVPLIIVHGVALAIFGGSAFCSGRALYREGAARTFAGYAIFVVSTISVVAFGALCLRALVFAR